MVSQHQILQPRIKNMGVYLGRRDIGMAQHCLDRAEVGAPGQKVSGKGMAQGVGRNFARRHAPFDRQFLDQAIEPVPRQMTGRPLHPGPGMLLLNWRLAVVRRLLPT